MARNRPTRPPCKASTDQDSCTPCKKNSPSIILPEKHHCRHHGTHKVCNLPLATSCAKCECISLATSRNNSQPMLQCKAKYTQKKFKSAMPLSICCATTARQNGCVYSHPKIDVSPSSGVGLSGCAVVDPLRPTAAHRVHPPSNMVRPTGDLSWGEVILGKVPLC